MICPQHGQDCIWYQHNSDRVGLDLGYMDGWQSAKDFAAAHTPVLQRELPVSDGRGDYYALGFLTGVTSSWCEDHPNDCLGRWACFLKVEQRARHAD